MAWPTKGGGAKVRAMGRPYSGPKPTSGGGTQLRAKSAGGAFKIKRAPNPFRSARRMESIAAGYKKVPKY